MAEAAGHLERGSRWRLQAEEESELKNRFLTVYMYICIYLIQTGSGHAAFLNTLWHLLSAFLSWLLESFSVPKIPGDTSE